MNLSHDVNWIYVLASRNCSINEFLPYAFIRSNESNMTIFNQILMELIKETEVSLSEL